MEDFLFQNDAMHREAALELQEEPALEIWNFFILEGSEKKSDTELGMRE